MKKKKDLMRKVNNTAIGLGFLAVITAILYLLIICGIDVLYMIGVLS